MTKSKARPISERGQRWMIGFGPVGPPTTACRASRLQGPSRRHAPGSLVLPCGFRALARREPGMMCVKERVRVCVCVRTRTYILSGGCLLLLSGRNLFRPAQHARTLTRPAARVGEPFHTCFLRELAGINIRYAKQECSPTALWALDGRRFGGLTASNRLVRVLLADGTPGVQLVKFPNLREDAPRNHNTLRHSTLIPPPCARFPRLPFPGVPLRM